MSYANNEEQKTTNDRRNRTTNSRKNQNARRKVNLLWNIGSRDERKFLKKNSLGEQENFSNIAKISSKG